MSNLNLSLDAEYKKRVFSFIEPGFLPCSNSHHLQWKDRILKSKKHDFVVGRGLQMFFKNSKDSLVKHMKTLKKIITKIAPKNVRKIPKLR